MKYTGITFLLAFSFLFTSCTKSKKQAEKNSEHTIVTEQNKEVSRRGIKIPGKVFVVLHYVEIHHHAPKGYIGGRYFGNYEGRLPALDSNGKHIKYQEWDVNPHIIGRNRGSERLITGNNEKAYYTPSHYKTYIDLKK